MAVYGLLLPKDVFAVFYSHRQLSFFTTETASIIQKHCQQEAFG